MANVQPSNQQVGEMESLSNMLSPEAKEFVPRQFSGMPGISGPLTDGLLGPGPGKDQSGVNGLPSYITTCYPFVNAGEPRFGGVRPRHRGKYTPQQALYMSQQFQHIQPGISRNRFPHPGKGYVPTSGWGPTAIGDMMQSYGNVPNGMPFDGGTYQNGFIHTSQLTGSGDGKEYSSARQNFSGDNFIETTHLLNGFKEPVNQQWKTKHKSEANRDGTMKICYKSSSVQTDFPEHIASATLEELPNTLYNNGQVAYKDHHKPGSRRSRHSSNRSASDIDTEDGMLLGRNTVSNGTNPSTEFTEGICVASLAVSDNQFSHMTNNSGSLSTAYTVYSGAPGFKGQGHNESSSTMHGTVNSVPYLNDSGVEPTFRRSYASIAQTNPSQTHKQNLVAAATDQGEQAICDNSVTVNRTTSAKKYVKESSRSASRIGNVNVNVAEIMQDLERADKKLEDSAFNSENAYQKQHGESETGPVKFLYSAAVKELPKAENHISNVSTISQVSQRSSKVNEHKGHLTNSHCVYLGNERKSGETEMKSHHGVHQKSQLKGHPQVNVSGQVKGHAPQQVKGQNFFSDSNKSDIDLDRKGHSLSDNNNNNQGDGEGKKKKRRRRRRKKKTGEVTAENEETVGASEEITLHFEDEEEFPDLSGCGGGCHPAISSQFPAATMSYSDIINNANTCNVQSTKTISPDEQFSPDTAGTSSVKESRSSRKRRKRREVANKAADAEMAEINLEQHMLELKMKQKLPLAAKKSVSPVRNAPSQGVWKLTPSSPASQSSSTGKKVSLLLPGTVATEPSHNSSPHQPNTSAVRQPENGVLMWINQASPFGLTL
ncbi:uncharacterized protein LOC132730055 [Ruditapes philippinarum]|uniref:uncharacterized protein LOC132730055 n=1 Tax=Ruditapes philippinarum TaxID=129788 RepID=UPI00295B1E3F|nr:uncharacterized protein LOC132730055 [Ruditapes philippinarum]